MIPWIKVAAISIVSIAFVLTLGVLIVQGYRLTRTEEDAAPCLQ